MASPVVQNSTTTASINPINASSIVSTKINPLPSSRSVNTPQKSSSTSSNINKPASTTSLANNALDRILSSLALPPPQSPSTSQSSHAHEFHLPNVPAISNHSPSLRLGIGRTSVGDQDDVISMRSCQSSTASTFRSSSLWSTSAVSQNSLVVKKRRRKLMAMHNRVSDELLFHRNNKQHRSSSHPRSQQLLNQHSIINSSVLMPTLTELQEKPEEKEDQAKVVSCVNGNQAIEANKESELVMTSDEDQAENEDKVTEKRSM